MPMIIMTENITAGYVIAPRILFVKSIGAIHLVGYGL